jgi:hypothetical protein
MDVPHLEAHAMTTPPPTCSSGGFRRTRRVRGVKRAGDGNANGVVEEEAEADEHRVVGSG